MSWATVIGQSLAVRLLSQAIVTGRVAHAYLFVGPDGVGKRTIAVELAKAMNCMSLQSDGSACDTCPSCHKMNISPPVHPDFMIVQPEGRFIKTDQIRELRAEMYARPYEGNMRVAVIDGADHMNPESGNRLLKLLEEPPSHSILVLLAENLSGVLPTLISRCQVVNFSPLANEDVAKALHEKLGLEGPQARMFASLSGGSLGLAARLAQDPEIAKQRDAAHDLLRQISDMDDLALLGVAEGLEKAKEHLDTWLSLLTVWLRDALLAVYGDAQNLVINADRLTSIRSLARQHGPGKLLAMLSEVAEIQGQLHRNVNVRLAMEVLLLHLRELTLA